MAIPWLVINAEKFGYEEFAEEEKASRVQCNEAPVVNGKVLEFFVNCMGIKTKENTEAGQNIGLVGGEMLRRLPSIMVMVAGNDPFRDEGLLFVQNLQNQG